MSDYPAIPDLVLECISGTEETAFATKRGGEWVTMSGATFKEQVAEFARGLYSLGVRKGDRVALHSENSTEWLLVDQAILTLGAVSVPIYTTLPGNQIAYIVSNADAKVYIASTESLYSVCAEDLQSLDCLDFIVGLRGSFGDFSHEEILERGRTLEDFEPPSVGGDDLATLIYTSGTTGVPKGVMLTHGNLTSNTMAVRERLSIPQGSKLLSYLPLAHSFERIATICYMVLDCKIYFVEDVQEIKDDIQEVRPYHMTTVPRLLEKVHAGLHAVAEASPGAKGKLMRWALGKAESFDVRTGKGGFGYGLAEKLVFSKVREQFGGMRQFTSGGAALAPEVESFFNGLGFMCGQGYGLTETSPVITVYSLDDLRPGSVGTVINGVECKIAEDGEILARGPNIMKGYYKLPDETAEVIGEDGWFHTGDIGHLDEDGHLYITDRKKLLFKLSTGKYIAPTPIETRLCNSPLLEHALVLGPGRKFCAALVTLDPASVEQSFGTLEDAATDSGVQARVQSIVDAANEGLPPWEQVKKFGILDGQFTIDSGELTPTMKVKRRVVREKYGDAIDALYA